MLTEFLASSTNYSHNDIFVIRFHPLERDMHYFLDFWPAKDLLSNTLENNLAMVSNRNVVATVLFSIRLFWTFVAVKSTIFIHALRH